MDRNEFMELVYETFADEPDNVLANGIIEAAEAYVEHEKAQLSQEGTTSDTISRTETVEHLRRVLDATVPITDYDSGYVDGIEFGISTVSTMPTIQPQSTAGQLNDGVQSTVQSTDLIDRQQTLNALTDAVKSVGVLDADDIKTVFDALPSVQPEKTQLSQQGATSDTISRQAAIDAINHICPVDTEYDCTLLDRVDVRYVLSELPPAQPEPKEGHWILHETPDGGEQYEGESEQE